MIHPLNNLSYSKIFERVKFTKMKFAFAFILCILVAFVNAQSMYNFLALFMGKSLELFTLM